jgi:large subunit ribosomal protein L6
MSRIGRSPIPVPSGVTVALGSENTVTVKGPQGELARTVPAAISIRQDGDVRWSSAPTTSARTGPCTG